jgi:hypothetical protein
MAAASSAMDQESRHRLFIGGLLVDISRGLSNPTIDTSAGLDTDKRVSGRPDLGVAQVYVLWLLLRTGRVA